MYFCYGIKNSSLEAKMNESTSAEKRESQQIELKIPQDRLKQSMKQRENVNVNVNANKANGFTLNASSLNVSQQQQQQWQTFE